VSKRDANAKAHLLHTPFCVLPSVTTSSGLAVPLLKVLKFFKVGSVGVGGYAGRWDASLGREAAKILEPTSRRWASAYASVDSVICATIRPSARSAAHYTTRKRRFTLWY